MGKIPKNRYTKPDSKGREQNGFGFPFLFRKGISKNEQTQLNDDSEHF